MATETFRFIEYSDKDVFIEQQGKIELKEYADNLVLYSSFDDSLNANYFEASKVPTITGQATTENWGVFGKHLLLEDGSLRYDALNFSQLTERGSIQLRVKPNFSNNFGYQEFLSEGDISLPIFPKIQTNSSRFGGASLNLVGGYEKYITYPIDNVSSLVQKGTITFFVSCNYTGIPQEDVVFLTIGDETDQNKIEIKHKSTGQLTALIYDQLGNLATELSFSWSADTSWNEISLSFDMNEGNNLLFLNGTAYTFSSHTSTRTTPVGNITVGGSYADFFIDDLAIFSEPVYTSNYTPRTSSIKTTAEYLLLLARFDTSFNLTVGSNVFISSLYPVNNGFGFKVLVKEDYIHVFITLEEGDTLQDIVNKIHDEISGTSISVNLNNGRIRISSVEKGRKVSIEDPDGDVPSLINILQGLDEPAYPNAPSSSVNIIDLYNGANNQNRLSLIHTDDSHLRFVMYNASGIKKVDRDLGLWNNEIYTWYAIEISWNKTIAEIFIDGMLLDAVKTGFMRGNGTHLYINSVGSYGFDELIVYNAQKNKEDYVVSQYALTPYTTSIPYIDIFFGSGFKEHEVAGLNLNCSSNIHFVVKVGNVWYYYYSGAWRTSDASFAQSSTPSVMETKFDDLIFEEEQDVTIRAYFHSDGFTLAWIDEITIVTEIGEAQPAMIKGTVSLLEPVDLSSDYNIVITTSVGSNEVDLSAYASDSSNVTLEEIKIAIDNANIPGLAPASDDGNGRLILRTEETGKDTFISISEGTVDDALSIVWGFEATDIGSQATGQYFDYTEIFRWIRSQLGAPTAPVELTDEQLQDCVAPAVYWYNYYRNARENTMYITLEGNPRDGWKIPQEVGGEDNIIEIIMKPRFPYTFYAGRTDIVGQIYLQWFFMQHQTNLRHMVGDYYLVVSTQKDINNIMGTEVKWNFYNGKLFIHPTPPQGMNIGIRFRSAISINEINTNIFIRNYALGKAKTILGTIRSTFGGAVPGGNEMLTLRGEALIAEGKEEMENVIQTMQKLTEPLGFDWG